MPRPTRAQIEEDLKGLTEEEQLQYMDEIEKRFPPETPRGYFEEGPPVSAEQQRAEVMAGSKIAASTPEGQLSETSQFGKDVGSAMETLYSYLLLGPVLKNVKGSLTARGTAQVPSKLVGPSGEALTSTVETASAVERWAAAARAKLPAGWQLLKDSAKVAAANKAMETVGVPASIRGPVSAVLAGHTPTGSGLLSRFLRL